jgi:hypothetical protein
MMTNEVVRESVKFLKEWLGLFVRHVLKDFLQDSAAVGVSGQGKRLSGESFADEEINVAVNALQRPL